MTFKENMEKVSHLTSLMSILGTFGEALDEVADQEYDDLSAYKYQLKKILVDIEDFNHAVAEDLITIIDKDDTEVDSKD
ncbi:hypothetical protein [Paucilactobacillus sp. N302-9]